MWGGARGARRRCICHLALAWQECQIAFLNLERGSGVVLQPRFPPWCPDASFSAPALLISPVERRYHEGVGLIALIAVISFVAATPHDLLSRGAVGIVIQCGGMTGPPLHPNTCPGRAPRQMPISPSTA